MGILNFLFGRNKIVEKERDYLKKHSEKKEKNTKPNDKNNIYSTSVNDFSNPRERSDKFYSHHLSNIGNFDEVSKLIDEEINLIPEELSFLRYLNGKSASNIAGYWTHEVNLNINKVINKLIKYNYITLEQDLNILLLKDLKSLLKEKELPISGKKSILIERIQNNFSQEEIESIKIEKTFYLTEKGKNKLKDIPESITHNHIFDKNCLDLIIDGNLEDAYKLIIEYENKKPAKRGINIDWSNVDENLNYFFENNKEYISKIQKLKFLKDAKNNELYIALIIFHIMLGKSRPSKYTIEKFITDFTQDVDENNIIKAANKFQDKYSDYNYKPYKGYNNNLFEKAYIYSSIAYYYEIAGRIEKAIEYNEKALTYNSDMQNNYRFLLDIYEKYDFQPAYKRVENRHNEIFKNK